MKKYPKYKPTGVDWIGHIPDTWLLTKFKYIIDFQEGLGLLANEFRTEGVPLIRISGVKGNIASLDGCNYVEKEKVETKWQAYKLKKWDILISCSASTDLTSEVLEEVEGSVAYTGIIRLRPLGDAIIRKFIQYLVRSTYYQIQINLEKTGSTIQHYGPTHLAKIRIVLPPLPEQTPIVAYLDYKTNQIETLIANKQKLIGLLQEERTTIINHAVTKGINAKAKLKPSGVDWIGNIPEHWKITKLKFIGDAFGGLTYSPNDVVENSNEGKLVLRSSNIQNGQLALDDNVYVNSEVSEKLTLRKGDILICSRNGSKHLIGKNICIDEQMEGNTFGAFMMIFRSNYWNFLYQYFNSSMFTSQSGLFLTATINQLTTGTLNNFLIAIPNTSKEQLEIVEYIKKEQNRIDIIVTKAKQEIELMKEYKTALISEVITGKVDVRDEKIK